MRWVKYSVGIIALLIMGALGAFYGSETVQDRVFSYAAGQQFGQKSQLSLTDNSLQVVLCGTSSPLPLRRAAKACTLVAAGGKLFLVDIGPEATENLALWRIPTPKIETVFLTHFHSDHIGELGEVNMQGWAQGRTTPINVFGPEGLDKVVGGFNQAYALDHQYRNAHHARDRGLLPLAASEMVANPVALPEQSDENGVRSVVVYDQGGLKVTAIETDHAPVRPAFSYRFDYKGRSVVISGDTKKYAPLAIAARGADVFVSEGQAHHLQTLAANEAAKSGQKILSTVLKDTREYHVSPVEAAQMANDAKVKMLVFTHMAPPIVNPLIKSPWLRGVNAVRPNGVKLGNDGMVITLPISNKDIQFGQLDG